MITVKLYGLLRLDSGVKELQAEAESMKELLCLLQQRLPGQDLAGCVLLVNGKRATKRTKLRDGDEVTLLSPVCGG